MASPRTRTKILDAAEQLFAERGYRGTSVRAITELAEVNLAAVAYHFGSKAKLLTEVAQRVIEPITRAQSTGLDRLLARTPHPAVPELVAAFVGPLFDALPSGGSTSRLIVTIISDPAEEMRGWTGPADDDVRDRYLAAFGHALPGISPAELWFRMRGILNVAALDRAGVHHRHTAHAPEAARDWAVTFVSAAMNAPPTAT